MISTKKYTALVVCMMTVSASLALNYVESVDGDLSGDPLIPTPISFDLGSNNVSGSMGGADVRDYLTFTIPAGQELSELILVTYEDLDIGGPGNTGYHSFNVGPTSEIPDGGNVGSFLAGDHLDPPSGVDLLSELATNPLIGTGITAPLGSGTYTYLIQQTGIENTGYALDFVITPEPSTLLLLALSAVAFRSR